MSPDQIYNRHLKTVEKKLGPGVTYGSDLYKLGKQMLGKRFSGVFMSDKIPKRFNCIIANLDTQDQPGSHWIAIARCPDGDYMVYDSFGRSTESIIGEGVKHLNVVDTENDAEQTDAQENCGSRCLAWLKVFDEEGPAIAQQI